MKKLIPALVFSASLSSASAADKVGAFLLGVQYEHDLNADNSVRVALSVPLFFGDGTSSVFGIGGGVDYLHHVAPASQKVQPYYGGGLGLGLASVKSGTSSASAFSVSASVLGGANLNLSDQWSLFADAGVGPALIFGSGVSGTSAASKTQIALNLSIRLGVNYKLR
jgi:hypothetical protein